MAECRLVVFDWDGTLMDSLSRIVQCMQLAAKDVGVEPASVRTVESVVGLALDLAVKVLHPQLLPDQVKQMCEQYSVHYVEAEKDPTQFFHGVESLLIGLSGAGCLLSVATGKSRKGLARAFRAHDIAHVFHSSRCADETRSKPEPDMLLEILDYHKVNAEQTIMVGDTEFDLEMAARAGVPSIGVTWGSHEKYRLQRHDPLFCVSSVSDLSECLHKLIKQKD